MREMAMKLIRRERRDVDDISVDLNRLCRRAI